MSAPTSGGAPGNDEHDDNATLCEYLKFTNCRLLLDGKLVKDDLWVRNGKILDGQDWFYSKQLKATRAIDCKGNVISPGFIDVQINGGYGIDFSKPAEGDLKTAVTNVARRLVQSGVTAFAPTIITSPASVYANLVPQVTPSAGGPDMGAAVLGLHLEGPFINVAKKGAHPAEHITNFGRGETSIDATCAASSKALLNKSIVENDEVSTEGSGGVTEDATNERTTDQTECIPTISEVLHNTYGNVNLHDHVCIVTLAPEIPGATEAITELTKGGVVVSLGHSRSNLEVASRAITHGATMITHLFNAMSAFHHRDPGIVGLLALPETQRHIFYGVIVDGFHTHPAALQMAYATHAAGCVLVTDAMAAMGLPAGTHSLGETTVEVHEDKRATVHGHPDVLAGSAATMDTCVRNFAKMVGLDNALVAATRNPAKLMGIDNRKGLLKPGLDADLVVLDDDCTIHATYIGGELCYASESHAKTNFFAQ